MGAPPYALSVSHFVSSVGADAGFAALIGLAVLILLYFAQARETSTLRDRFAEADDQVRRLEQRIAQLARTTAAPAAGAPAPAPAGVQRQAAAAAGPSAQPRPVRPAPFAPAFVGAPAVSAATRFVPRADEEAIAIRARDAQAPAHAARVQTPAPASRVPVGAGVAAGRGGGGGSAAPPDLGNSGQGGPAAPVGPAPATAAGAGVANGGGSARASSPAPAAAPKPYRIAGARPPGGTPPPRRPVAPPPPERRRLRSGLLIAAGLLLVIAVVAVLIVVTSNTGTSSPSATSAGRSTPTTAANRHRARAAALRPSAITVAVLNGTSTTNLAHDVSLKLGGYGYKPGTIATATDQTQTATVVGYLPGQRRAALIVARSLSLGPASVQPVDQSNQAVACPQASCSAQVVVTVGSDLASAASTSTTSTG